MKGLGLGCDGAGDPHTTSGEAESVSEPEKGYPAVGRKAGEEPGRSAKPGNVTVPGEDAGRNRAFWRLEERALKCGREGQRRLERI